MPLIKLENNFLTDYQWIRSIQFFPNNSEHRHQYFTMQIMDYKSAESDDSEIFEIDAKSLKLIIRAPSLEDFKQLTINAIKEGIVVGDILASIYLMDKFKMPEPSLNKAFFVSQEFAKKNKYGDGASMAISERYVKERWEKYKPVAHFWAAHRLTQAYPIASERETFAANFELYLGVAKELQSFGLSYIPLRARPKTPLLDNITTWLLPENIQSKTLVSAIEPDLLKNILKKYKAPQS